MDNYRLGNLRRFRRDYSQNQRDAGLDSLDRIKLDQLIEDKSVILIMLMFTSRQIRRLQPNIVDNIERNRLVHRRRRLILLLVILDEELQLLITPHLIIIPLIDHTIRYNIIEYPNAFTDLGFQTQHIQLQFDLLNIPDTFILQENTRSQWNVPGEHAFLYFLYRIRNPSHSMKQDENRWGYSFPSLSKIFNAVVKFLDTNHSFRLRRLDWFSPRFPEYRDKFRQKFTSEPHPHDPFEAANCVGFIDACRFPICRATTYPRQAMTYNFKSRHNHGIQVIQAIDGMFMDTFDGLCGRRHDLAFFHRSRVEQQFSAICRNRFHGHRYTYYGDKAYHMNLYHCTAAKKRNRNLPAHIRQYQRRSNRMMGKYRISVEWGFGKVKARCPILTKKKEVMQLFKKNLPSLVRVCILMTNIDTTLRGSQTSLYYKCQAPSIQEYLR